jgi:hypothetical protein
MTKKFRVSRNIHSLEREVYKHRAITTGELAGLRKTIQFLETINIDRTAQFASKQQSP